MPPVYAHDPFLFVHQVLQNPWLDLPMVALSVACEGWVLAIIALALFSWAESSMRRLAAVYLPFGLALAGDGWVVRIMKEHWRTPRPFEVYGPALVRTVMEPLHQLGFPSGHSSAAAVLAAYAIALYGRRAAPLALFAVLGGLSRIYVGAHWAIDVVGGWALGVIFGLLAWRAALKLAPSDPLARGGARDPTGDAANGP